MEPILDKTSGRGKRQFRGQTAGVILTLLLGLGVARADFSGDFGQAFWTNSPPGLGSVFFTNSSTELVLAGPNQPASKTTSTDPITYNGPLGGGLRVNGTVQFRYTYNSGDALSQTVAEFSWLPPGGGGGDWVHQVLGNGGPGASVTDALFITPSPLIAGTTFAFSLFTDTLPPAGKPSALLVVNNFVFFEVPEPVTGTLLANGLVALGLISWWRSRRRAASRQ
jgi:hypothetical protein